MVENQFLLFLLRLESNQLHLWLGFPYQLRSTGFSTKVSRIANTLLSVFRPDPLHVWGFRVDHNCGLHCEKPTAGGNELRPVPISQCNPSCVLAFYFASAEGFPMSANFCVSSGAIRWSYGLRYRFALPTHCRELSPSIMDSPCSTADVIGITPTSLRGRANPAVPHWPGTTLSACRPATAVTGGSIAQHFHPVNAFNPLLQGRLGKYLARYHPGSCLPASC